MNKVKLLYDVITTMKEDKQHTGTLKLSITKDGTKVIESVTQFNDAKCCQKFNSFHHHGSCRAQGHPGVVEGQIKDSACCGFKAKLSKIAFALCLLNAMQVEEQGTTRLISLSFDDLPAEMKTMLLEMHAMHIAMKAENEEACCMHEMCDLEKAAADIKLKVNAKNEVEQLQVKVSGNCKNEAGELKNFIGEIDLVLQW